MKNEEVAIFKQKEIRRSWHDDEWYFSVIDIVEVLAKSSIARRYWSDLKIKLKKEGYSEVYEKIVRLKMRAPDGKTRSTDCASTETMLRIIQSISSPYAEPLKRWLARVGHDRIKEIADPELAMNRAKEFYKKKGYSKEWIDKRLRGITVRQNLTEEWGERGIKNSIEYAILTNEIMTGTFDRDVQNYKEFKGLKQENLRDHMDDMELILTMLAEATTTKLHRDRDSNGFIKIKHDASDGGRIAGETRKKIEKISGKPVSTHNNYLDKSETMERIDIQKKNIGGQIE